MSVDTLPLNKLFVLTNQWNEHHFDTEGRYGYVCCIVYMYIVYIVDVLSSYVGTGTMSQSSSRKCTVTCFYTGQIASLCFHKQTLRQAHMAGLQNNKMKRGAISFMCLALSDRNTCDQSPSLVLLLYGHKLYRSGELSIKRLTAYRLASIHIHGLHRINLAVETLDGAKTYRIPVAKSDQFRKEQKVWDYARADFQTSFDFDLRSTSRANILPPVIPIQKHRS